MLTFTIGKSSISIMIDGEFNTVDKSAANYPALRDELQKAPEERDIALIKSLISTKKMIEAFSYGRVKITEDEQVIYDGQPITNYLAARMLQILGEGYDVTPFAKFMERVHANPQTYTRNELYEWLEAADLPIMPDGRFVAFKKVTKDYKDCHSGMFDNSVGQTLVMERSACDPDRNNECSVGFHFCSAGYLSNFRGDRVMVLAIDPADVTAIPKDYNMTKGRTCRYEVIGELAQQSDAYKQAWKRGVVEFDDDQELPDVSFESKPKSVKLKPMQMTDARDKASFTGIGFKPKDKPVAKRSGKSKGPTTQVTKPVGGGTGTGTSELVFTTNTGLTLTETQINDAVASQGGLRPAARFLTVGDSTLRGWIKKIKDRVQSKGPAMSPLAATRTPEGLIFKTADGREIPQADVEMALQHNNGSNRAAGRALNVGESTIRGWRKKGGF